MLETKHHGVKCLPGKSPVRTFFRSVQHISQKGMSNAAHVYANLMGAASFQLTLYIGETAETFQYPVMGYCRFSVSYMHRHFFSFYRVSPDISFNGTLVLF